jgi:hypothetical protein
MIKAMLKTIRSPDPQNWAAFTLIGGIEDYIEFKHS